MAEGVSKDDLRIVHARLDKFVKDNAEEKIALNDYLNRTFNTYEADIKVVRSDNRNQNTKLAVFDKKLNHIGTQLATLSLRLPDLKDLKNDVKEMVILLNGKPGQMGIAQKTNFVWASLAIIATSTLVAIVNIVITCIILLQKAPTATAVAGGG